MVLYGFAYGASRLVPMGAVPVFAMCREFENFFEVMSYLFIFHVESAETFDARCVDDISVAFYGEHLGKGCGMHSFVVSR